MPKLSISDAAERLGVSREAIHNRIRRGSLQSVVEGGVKLVLLDEEGEARSVAKKADSKKGSHQSDERYVRFLEEQNIKLQEKVETLQGETRTLRDQKEQMLIEERIKIEQIYKEKDEQLKNIINAISSKFMLHTPKEFSHDQEELIEAEINENATLKRKLTSLKKYIKSQNFSKKRSKEIKELFMDAAKEDKRVITIGKKQYIDLQKYDYGDFFLS